MIDFRRGSLFHAFQAMFLFFFPGGPASLAGPSKIKNSIPRPPSPEWQAAENSEFNTVS